MLAISIVLTSFLAGIVAGVGEPGLPSCAGNCVSSFGGCQQLDVKCICSDSTLIANLACCVSTACDAADQEKTIKFADALCAGQSVSDLPQSATCAPGASGAASTTTTSRPTPVPQGSTTTATTTPSTVAASVSSSLASASSSVLSVESSASKSAASAQASASSSVLSAQSSASGAAAASSSSTGGAGKMEGMGLGLVFAGMVAAL